jgi:uncharacterized protein YndB with AHSA1/START domain
MAEFDTPIIHNVFIRANREKVFDAMTTAKGLDGWFTRGAVVDRKPGGTIIFKWVDWGPDKVNTTSKGPVIEVNVPERFVFQWWQDHLTTVEMDFEAAEDGTVVKLKEYGYEDTEEGHRRCLECATGWGEALTLLKFYVEHGITY